jgi:uncharacterized membrane protein
MERLHLWHPLFVHFTVGLLTISVALYFLARFVKSGAWRERFTIAANLNLWIGALITALTVGAGMIAFGAAPHSDDIEYLMKTHATLAYGTFGLFAVLAGVSAWPRRRTESPPPPLWFLAGLLVALAALTATGYFGGELVFSHAVGVEKRD